MCGIVALLNKNSGDASCDRKAVENACDRMALRGPDAQGIWQGVGITMGHRRLSILDLDARSTQPMHSADGRYVIVFNGEIYNFRELRRELEEVGVKFHTTSDTEVLLALFAAEGEAMLPRLRGMFAFAIWDTLLSELFVARDPYGIKPLYYGKTIDGGFIVASQVKALLASGQVSREREPAGLAGFYIWGSVPEPWTLYRGVFSIPAGHCMRVCNREPEVPVSWHDIRQHWRGEGAHLSAEELQYKVQHAVTDSVRAHLVADVPVCVFLSGGIDSAVMAGIASQLGVKVEGITIGFDEFTGQHDDEVPIAAVIAEHYGLPHVVRRVSRAEFELDIPYILEAMDQPSIDGVNTWFASKAAAERGYKVVLSGVGGDELFCGYPSFKMIPRISKLGRAITAIPGVRSIMDAPCAWLARQRSQPKLAGIPEFISSVEGMYFLQRCLFLPVELPGLMGEDMAREGLARLSGTPPGMASASARDSTASVGLCESTYYLRNQLLRDSDWASMAHSLELRTPLVDAALLGVLGKYVASFTDGVGKAMLARSPGKPLPDIIINRPKTGFSMPMSQWLTEATNNRSLDKLPLKSEKKESWARRWALSVIREYLV